MTCLTMLAKRGLSIAAATVSLLLPLQAAQAVTISGTYSFSFANAGPINPFSGSVFISFDNSSNYVNSTSGISVVSLPSTLAFAQTLGFNYSSDTDQLIIGGVSGGNGVLDIGPNDFGVIVNDASGANRLFDQAVYRTSDSRGSASSGTVTFTAGAVPEPASIALLGLGALGLFATNRARRRA